MLAKRKAIPVAGPTQHGIDSRQKLGYFKRFGDIVRLQPESRALCGRSTPSL